MNVGFGLASFARKQQSVGGISLIVRLDSADVDAIHNKLVEQIGDSSVAMNLGDGVWAFSSIFQSVRLECEDHNLVAYGVVVLASSLVFLEIVFVDEGLSLFTDQV